MSGVVEALSVGDRVRLQPDPCIMERARRRWVSDEKQRRANTDPRIYGNIVHVTIIFPDRAPSNDEPDKPEGFVYDVRWDSGVVEQNVVFYSIERLSVIDQVGGIKVP